MGNKVCLIIIIMIIIISVHVNVLTDISESVINTDIRHNFELLHSCMLHLCFADIPQPDSEKQNSSHV